MSAWLVSFATSALMTSFGVSNRHLGWKRERSDLVLDELLNWAVVRQDFQIDVGPAPAAPPVAKANETPAQCPATRATLDLTALASALGSSVKLSEGGRLVPMSAPSKSMFTPTIARSR